MARQISKDELVPNLSAGMAAIDTALAAKAPAANSAPLFSEHKDGQITAADGSTFEPSPSNLFPPKA